MINDNKIWIHFESIPRVLENGDILWTGILNDISKRKNTELEIELKSQELQNLNANKDRFISILGHDLKNLFINILGLSKILTCKEFVEKHGGKIWVESEVDKGSDFKITLPYAMSD